MSDESPTPLPPLEETQFDRAEPIEAKPSAVECASCKQGIRDCYYEVSGKVLCQDCQAAAAASLSRGSRFGGFLLASIYGLIAAGIGCAIYYGIRAATGYEFGLVAIFIGLMVGGA